VALVVYGNEWQGLQEKEEGRGGGRGGGGGEEEEYNVNLEEEYNES